MMSGSVEYSSKNDRNVTKLFGDIANRTSQAAGRAMTFLIAIGIVLVWAITGPLFQYSDTWQLAINTGTTIITFLMVFLIQNSQNRDSAAIQIKLDELIRVSTAHNSLMGIERLTGDEIEEIRAKREVRAKVGRTGGGFRSANENESQTGSGSRSWIRMILPHILPASA